jgi:zinc transport system substrate-binding protein
MALNVAGNVPGVTISNFTPPITGCLHDYAPTTEQLKKLANADVFVANGAGMESFLERITAQFPQVPVITLADNVPLIRDGQGQPNPHVWVSITDAITQVRSLGQALSRADTAHARQYQENAAAYILRLDSLRIDMRQAMLPYSGRPIVTFHEAFPYFAREFSFTIAAVVEREPGSAPSARELAATIQLIKKAGIKTLFSEPQYPTVSAQAIARETGATIYTLDPAVTGPETPNAYILIMQKNLEVLKRAFGASTKF